MSNSYNGGGDKKLVAGSSSSAIVEEFEGERALVDAAFDRVEGVLVQSMQFGSEAAGAAVEKPVLMAPGAAVEVRVLWLINAAAVAANGTNNSKYELINKGSDGSGSTVLATFDGATEAFAAFDVVAKPFTAVDLNGGDVLSLKKSVAGSGQASTDLLVLVGYKPKSIA